MARLERSHALVTGAGRGIGRAIALALAREGASLALVARTQKELEQTAQACEQAGAASSSIHAVDATHGSALDDLAHELLETHGIVDILVNNAGMAVEGDALTGDLDAWNQAMQLNVLAPMRLTRRLAPTMAQRETGTIINIGSVAAIEGMTDAGVYSATKHALRGWSLSCYQKLRHHGIKVVLINPAFVDTKLTAGVRGAKRERMLSPDDVAEAAMLAVRTSASCCPEEITLRLTKSPLG